MLIYVYLYFLIFNFNVLCFSVVNYVNKLTLVIYRQLKRELYKIHINGKSMPQRGGNRRSYASCKY